MAAMGVAATLASACGQSKPEVEVVSISGAECEGDSCVCAEPLVSCGSFCIDTASDPDHCGACDRACLASQVCELGACACPAPTVACGDACVELSSDESNCGACGNACSDGQICEDSACVCPAGTDLCGDSCTNLQTDANNCGACGNACSGGQVCDGGDCVCPAGQELCDGQCIDTQSDDENCGACGNVCGLGEGCSAGECQGGALGADGCQGLARDLVISEVAAYQTVRVPVAQGGAPVVERGTDLVAGRDTLVRVFVTPDDGFAPRPLSGRLFLDNGGEEVIVQHSEEPLTIAGPSEEDDRESTFEFRIPGDQLTSETEFAVEIVECGEEAPAAPEGSLASRFPDAGGETFGAVEIGNLRIHIVPLRANGRVPDTSEEGLALYRAAFLATYPIDDIEFTVGEPLDVADPQDWGGNLDRVRALRQSDGADPDVYYYGMLRPTETFGQFCGNSCTAGIGYVPNGNGRFAAQVRAAMGVAYGDASSAFTMLHELGHNHGRRHAPCVPNGSSIADVDQAYPYQGGRIGVYGYSASTDLLIAPDNVSDVMGYCRNQWLSDYTYNGLLAMVRQVNQTAASEVVAPERIGAWRVALVDAERGARWGIPMPAPSVASGEPATARVLDAAGSVITEVDVYRTELSELGGVSVQVPEPQPSWHSILLEGAAPLAFTHAQ